MLTLYVDDTLIAANNLPLLHTIKSQLHVQFLLSDIGKVHHLLSLQVTCDLDHGWLCITQALYIQQKLAKFRFLDLNLVLTPMASGTHLSTIDCPITPIEKELCAVFLYANAVNSLNWANLCTCSNISFSISVLTQYMHIPENAHICACKHTFCYLRSTIGL